MSKPQEKKKFVLWAYPDTLDKVTELYRQDSCRTKSAFIEKAIRYYVGHLTAKDDTSYLPNAFLSNMEGLVMDSEHRISRNLFKIAVEMAMMMNILASMQDIDDITLQRLRGECVREVKRLNGSFSFEDAVEWQK